jgi:class 3 adenylate cyclase
MAATRRLAAILAADVAGYSRLMGADEEGTLERLKALLRELIDPKIAEHHGHIVKTTGDGMLMARASSMRCVALRPGRGSLWPLTLSGGRTDTGKSLCPSWVR